MKRPDRSTVANEVVRLAAATMADKADSLRLVADASASTNPIQATRLRAEADAIDKAVNIMNARGGSWT